MADRPDDDNNEDPGRDSDDRNDDLLMASSGSNSRMSLTGAPDAKSEGKRKKFRPLDAVRKLFKRRPKLKEIDSARARSTSALYGHASGEGEDEEGGFLSRISLRKNKSRSEDSVLVEARTNQGGILRKLAYSVEGINKSIYASNSGKSSSRNSLNSTESQEHFKEGFKSRTSSIENSEPCVDLEAVAKTEALNTDAAKFKISVRPKGRKGSRQSRKNRQKVASNLPCLNEEQQIVTNPSLNEDENEEMAPKLETEKLFWKEEIGVEPVVKKKRESSKIPFQDLAPKPRPKSTPATIHSTPESKPQRINAVLDLESAEGPKHFPNPELLEFGKIRSKSLDIEGRVPRSSDLGLSPVRKPNFALRRPRADTETISSSRSGGKSPEINKFELTSANTKNGIERLQLEQKSDFKKMDFERENTTFSGGCEKHLYVGLDSQKRPVSPDIGGAKNLKPMKSPVSLDLGLRFRQNPDDDERVPTPIRSPVKSIDLGLRPMKSPIQTPNLESKPIKPRSPTRDSNLELRSILSNPEHAEEIKPLRSLKTLDLGLKPLKCPVHTTDSSSSSVSRPLLSPVNQIQDMEDSPMDISGLQESTQKLGQNSGHDKSLKERSLQSSSHANAVQTPTKQKQNGELKSLQLQAPNNENKDLLKSPKKIIANLELSNLATKPLRGFSDPKSPRSTLRSPNLSPRSPILPPKPIRSPLGSPNLRCLDAKSSLKGFEFPKLGLKFENVSESSENLFSKSPQSPSVASKSFTLTSKPSKSSPTEGKGPNEFHALVPKPLKEHSEFANEELSSNSVKRFPERTNLELKTSKSPSSDNPSFSDFTQKPLKKVLAEQDSEQKLATRSPLNSPKSEDSNENPFLKSINLEPKSPKPSDSTKDISSKPANVETKPVESPHLLKKSFERPNLGPKPLKSPVEAPSGGSKFNLPSNKTNRSCNKSSDTQILVEECKSKVGKNLEIFQAIGNQESKVAVSPKMSTGSSKVSSIVGMTESFKPAASSNMPEKSKIPDKSNIVSSSVTGTGSIVTTNKPKVSEFSKPADSSSIPTMPKVANTFKMADMSNLSEKPKVASGGFKTESSKMLSASDKSKNASTSKPSFSSCKIAIETSKITESSNQAPKLDYSSSSQKDTQPKLPSTTRVADPCKISDSPKVIATPKKLDSSKHSKEISPDEANIVVTSSKMTAVDDPTEVATDPAKPLLVPKLKPFELTSSASKENAGTGIDVSQNNTNRLSALFEARSVTTSHVDPGTTVKIEVIAKDDSGGQKPVKLREKGTSTEKISELSSRQSKVLDLVKNFQKLQVT